MGKHIQIGALVEKEHGLSAYNDISSLKGVLYAFLETGRSNDLFSEKQFGEFGEAAILTMSSPLIWTPSRASYRKK